MKKLILISLLSIFFAELWYSCEKSNEYAALCEITFSIFDTNNQSKSLKSADLDLVEKIVITILKEDNSITAYASTELEVYKLEDYFLSQKIALVEGAYKITEFFLIDSENNVIFAIPVEGSDQAVNVSKPLPIHFSVVKDNSTSIEVEVLSTDDLLPTDFGLNWFNMKEPPIFSFLVSVSELGSNNLLGGTFTLTSGVYSYTKTLQPVGANIITVLDNLEIYEIKITNTDYEDYQHDFTNEELKQYDTIPLIIEQTKVNNAGLIFWNKLGSQEEIESSEIGPDMIMINSPDFEQGVFNNGMNPYSGGFARFTPPEPDLEEGCLEFWIKPNYNTPSTQTRFFIDFNEEQTNNTNWGTKGISFYHHFNNNLSCALFLDHYGDLCTINTQCPDFSTGDKIHLAVTWKTGRALEIYYNGDLLAQSSELLTESTLPWAEFNVGTSWDENRPFEGVIDNLKMWNYAKTDFSDRFDE